jgi:hypothetical protein
VSYDWQHDPEGESRSGDRLSEIVRTRSQMQPNRQASVYDWKPYTPSLVQELKDNDLWDGSGVDMRAWQTRSDAGDHYYIRPAGSLFNTLPDDHPHKHTGDRGHWEVDHLPPEYGHDPEGYIGDIYGPTALNKNAEPVDGVSPHGFDSMQHAMDWVQSRHPEESFNPDDRQDPFDPRLIGAGRRVVARLDPADIYRLAGDGMSWDDTMRYIDETLTEGEKTNLDDYFNDDYLDGPHPGTLPRPGQHADPDDPICPTCNGPEGKSDPYCPRCGLGEDGDLWQTTIHRAALDMVDLIRLAGDGMSWEDTLAHIDQVLGEGPQNDDPYAASHVECRYCDGPATHGARDLSGYEFPVCERCIDSEDLHDRADIRPIDTM